MTLSVHGKTREDGSISYHFEQIVEHKVLKMFELQAEGEWSASSVENMSGYDDRRLDYLESNFCRYNVWDLDNLSFYPYEKYTLLNDVLDSHNLNLEHPKHLWGRYELDVENVHM